jgi:hypothetical protein
MVNPIAAARERRKLVLLKRQPQVPLGHLERLIGVLVANPG